MFDDILGSARDRTSTAIVKLTSNPVRKYYYYYALNTDIETVRGMELYQCFTIQIIILKIYTYIDDSHRISHIRIIIDNKL